MELISPNKAVIANEKKLTRQNGGSSIYVVNARYGTVNIRNFNAISSYGSINGCASSNCLYMLNVHLPTKIV